MVALGIVLLIVGAILLVAEAHLPAGVLGVAGALALAAGAALAIAGAGGGAGVVIAAALAAGLVAVLWVALAARKALAASRTRTISGREALSGHTGVVRAWNGNDGQVLVDGALWRACCSWPDDEEKIVQGDSVVVERVRGLTLAVRKAEDWETTW
ncbi:MAG: NfeD family protein [Gaiellaceae bacterium]